MWREQLRYVRGGCAGCCRQGVNVEDEPGTVQESLMPKEAPEGVWGAAMTHNALFRHYKTIRVAIIR